MENYSEELQNQSEELCSRSSLSRAKKSWGFRRTTIARREFLEEVGELARSPSPVRKTRSRRSNQIPLTTPETQENTRHTPAISVLDELEWSAPSSPVAEDTKPATETFAAGNLDPSLWQDCGSAFHTAFSLLGGGESFQVEMPDALAAPDTAEASDSVELYDSCVADESAMPENEDVPDGIHDGEMLLGEIGEMVMQKDGQELKSTTIRDSKGRKGRGRVCATGESAMPNDEDSPGGEMLLREIGEMLTRKSGKEQRFTTIRGVRGRKKRVTICPTHESTVPNNKDSIDDITHSVLGDLEEDSDMVLISAQEGGCSDGELLLRKTAGSLMQKDGRGESGTTIRAVKVGKGSGRICATDESAIPSHRDSASDMAHSGLDDARGDSDVVLISPQEEPDSDGENTLIEIAKLFTPEDGQGQREAIAKGGKGRGRKKGRGRGRRKAKGRGKGRSKPGGLQSNTGNDEMVIDPTEPEQEVEKLKGPDSPIEISTSPAHTVSSLSPAQQSNSDCICIESDVDQVISETHDQFDDAPGQKYKEVNSNGEPLPISDHEGYDPDALTCICRQKRNDRFMIRCVSCQEWYHGNCVGISGTDGCKDYVCPACITKNQSEHRPECCPQPEDDCSHPQGLILSRQEDMELKSEQQAVKDPEMVAEEEEKTEVPAIKLEPQPQASMKDGTLPLCIGPGCPREALPESVYCGTDCILQHAAATMKTLCVPKEPKTRGGTQKKAPTPTASAKGQRSCGTSKNLGTTAEDEDKEKDDDGGQKEAAPPSPCDPAPTGVQATSLPSSKLCTASKMDKTQEAEAAAPSNQSLEDSAAHVAPSSQSAGEPEAPPGHLPETPKEPNNISVSADTCPSSPPKAEQSCQATVSEAPSTTAASHQEMGALTVSKKAFIIPKKPSAPQPSSSPVLPSTSGPKPPPVPALVSETRNLLVPPAPSAPSSRPSQPNNQIRQSIQKSLVSILVKRVGECEDLKTSESEIVKLVASIEVEMFDIFRNTDSKYMNKYRTIMFNVKDPRNKGLLYGFVRGEISPFRLVRMTQKDMQAIKAPETTEKKHLGGKDAAPAAPPVAKVTSVLPKPEAVKVDLPTLNPIRPNRSSEQKKSLPPPAVKTKTIQPIQSSAVPDMLTCMLKDTTSEHKNHIFDLKCKICTGQISTDEEEPSKKKPRVSETKDRNYPSWRKSTEDDSPLQAPPESPDLDSPTLFIMDTSPHFTNDSPVLTIVESPASPIMDSPASPVLESPASPVMESPTSPTPDPPKASTSKSALIPAVNPAVSTTTMARRDPRTAASRLSVVSNNPSAPYAPPKETKLAAQTAPGSLPPPPTKVVPKSILKPLSADPRFYSALSRSVTSESPSVDETSQFLAKQEILWKGFINMLTVAKFVSKAYLVSGPAENLKADLPDTIQIGGRILPETVWDYVEKVKTSFTKELCVIRFHPATEEEEVAYVSLFSYFSSRRRFGVVASGNRSIKDLYLVPLGANETVPSMLEPLEGPGLETKRPNLLLGLAIIQRTKRSGVFIQETEDKRPKLHLAKDPMWIPKPPVLYGSDKLDVFQPYDPEMPANPALPTSSLNPGSPSDSVSSLTKPSALASVRPNLTVAPSVTAPATQATSSGTSVTPSGDKTPLQTILNSLFGSNQTESTAATDASPTNISTVKKPPALSQVAATMVDPIVQQYGQKSKIKEIEEENDFDRPYDPEEEYHPGGGYGMPPLKIVEKNPAVGPAELSYVDDDVAYDPEDETIFADVSGIAAKPPIHAQIADPSPCQAPVSTEAATPAPTSTASSDGIAPNLPSGTVVVSAATLSEQQRMLEELNKQIEEQKRQLKEQEEALRQQREAVGMFMAHFSVSDSMMPPPTKTLPLSQLSSLKAQAEPKPSELTDTTAGESTEISSNAEKQTVEPQDATVLKDDTEAVVTEGDETITDAKEGETYSSAGEIEDSDVAYDPEDESFFKEVEEDPFGGHGGKMYDRCLSRRSRSSTHKGSQNSSHSRKRRSSPKRRSHRERDRRRSPSRKSQRRSSSHSQKRRERDRHRRGDRDRSRHRGRDHSERQGRHRKEHNMHRQSLGRRSTSLLSQQEHVSFSPEDQTQPSSELELSSTMVAIKHEPDEQNIKCNLDESCPTFSHDALQKVKVEIPDQPGSDELLTNSFSNQGDPTQGTSVLVNISNKQQSQIESKIESMIPLREIDPPIRDSPESPDPDPRFVKPSSIETKDATNTEKMQDACIRFPGPISRVPGMPSISSSDSVPDLPIQNKQGRAMIEARNTEQLMKGSEKSRALNCESSFMQGMSPEVKGLLGLKMEPNTSEPEKTHGRLGVKYQQYKSAAEPNVLGCGSKSSLDLNPCSTVPREDQGFPANGRRIDQAGQEDRPPLPNITNPDWRGHDLPPSSMSNQRFQTTGFGPHVIDPHCSVEGSAVQDHWRGPNRRGSCVVRGRGGPSVQDERKYQTKWRGPSIDNPGQTGQDFMTSGPGMEGPMHDRRDPGNPHSRRTDPERGGPNKDSQDRGIRGPQGATFERRTLLGEGPGSHRRGQTGPDFSESWPDTEPWFDQRNLPMKGAEAGPGNIHFLGPDPIGPEYSGLEPEGYPMDHSAADKGPDFRGPEQFMNHPHSGMRGLGCPEFKGPGLDRRIIGDAPQTDRRGPDKRIPFMSNLRPDKMGPGPGHPDFHETAAEWRSAPIEASGYMRTSVGGPINALEPGRIGPVHPEPWRPELDIGDSNIDCPGPERGTPGGQNLGGQEPDYPGAWTRGPGPDFMEMQVEKPGPGQRTRRRGREPFRVSDHESEYQNTEGPESANFRGLGLERRPPGMERPPNCRGFPDIPRFSIPEPERSPAMDGCESDRRGSHFREVKPEGPALEGPAHTRRGFRGLDPSRHPCDNIGTDIRDQEPNRREQGVPGLRELGDEFASAVRQKDPVTGNHRHRRDNWHETEFMGSEPIQGEPDIEGPGSRGTSHTFRGPRRTNPGGSRSETERWKEQHFRDSSLERRGRDLQEQWPNGRGLSFEAVEHERNYSDNDWKLHRDRSPRFTHEGPDEQFQRGQGPLEWRGPENRGQKILQERPTMPGRGPRGEPNCPDFRSPELDRDHPGSTREESRNDLKNPDSDQPNRWGSGIAMRGSRVPDTRRKIHDRRIPIMRGPGPDMRVSPDVENEFRQTDFRDRVRGSNMEGPHTLSRGPGFETSSINKRADMEDLERRVPRGLEPECAGPDSRNFTFEGPEARRFSDCGRMRSERQGDNVEIPGSIREGSEDFRRVNRGPNMRRPGPELTNMRDLAPGTSGVRHGPGRWDTLTEGSRSESRRGKPALSRFNSPSEVARFQGPSGPPCPGYDQQQSQQGAQPQGRKAALLPTPTGPICFPNLAVKNPSSFGPEGKHAGRSMPRGRGRGRSVSRDR